MSKTDAIAQAKMYVNAVKQSGIPVTAAYVFGSHILGTSRPGSDIDTCIVSPNFGSDRQQERITLLLMAKDDYQDIEPHPISPMEFQDPHHLLSHEIKQTGIQII